ncbi:unnamed protein product [Choristocarpus tenellus]
MGDGWETARNPDRPAVLEIGEDGLVKAPGSDWAVLKLGAIGTISRIVVDTNRFKGNFPESFMVEACLAPMAAKEELLRDNKDKTISWKCLVPRVCAGPSREHTMELAKGDLEDVGPVSHLKVSIFPDGGIMRLRAFGQRFVNMNK